MSQTAQDPGDPLVYPRHERYWIAGADLHVLVGGMRFRIHSYFLRRDSSFWKSLIDNSRSQGDYGRRPGSHESVPLVVDEDPEDFATFLWIFYNPRYDRYETTLDQWVTILRLAKKWDCPTIRQFAISYIDNFQMEPMEKIRIYQEYNVPQGYLLPICFELATRERGLEREIFHALDDDTLYSIVVAREMLRDLPSTSPLPADQSEEERETDILATAFELTPQEVQALRARRSREDLGSISDEATPEDPGASGDLEPETGPDDTEVLVPTPEAEAQGVDDREGQGDQETIDVDDHEVTVEVSRQPHLLDYLTRVLALRVELLVSVLFPILFMCAAVV